MPDPYTQEQAEEDIATIRGDHDRLNEHLATSGLFVGGRQLYSLADSATTTVTAASQTRLTTSYNVPANEAAVSSAYQIRFGGNGTWGSSGSGQLLSFNLTLGAVTLLSNLAGIQNTTFSLNAVFRFSGTATIVFSATGASGGVFGDYCIVVTQQANAVAPGTAASNTVSLADARSTAASVDTTGDLAFIMKAGWAGTVGAPTISNQHTVFAKIA